ncbi:hypothetical protein GXP67_20805 [Rhodocytophaga rosea]|uniref:ARG and Rhodanese-Phosphatase-superfamily-associated domain-containing protein n=1 Tax=Rhodocytophaga rosea TaxID=2704465 RepID=A0A6C0GLJ6_9BACT|nr:DUF6569 family protein [Rhodocytophaga rosea]QHT68916.1 hypothetical protein GXP67_20805 [Rhodocytophaga rosea]
MTQSLVQAQLADYISACEFRPFEYPVDQSVLRIFTIHTQHEFPKPIIELSKALEQQLAEITEVDQAGSVQQLYVLNHSQSHLLIYEGSLLKGAKQNRVVNATLLLPPVSKNTIPASCVEQGRWHYSSRSFSTSDHHSPQFLRKSIRRNVSASKNLMGNQSEVWSEIRRYALYKQVSNLSSDFEDIYTRSSKTESLFPVGLQLPPCHGVFLNVREHCSMDFVANQEAFMHLQARLIAGYEQQAQRESKALVSEENPVNKVVIPNRAKAIP